MIEYLNSITVRMVDGDDGYFDAHLEGPEWEIERVSIPYLRDYEIYCHRTPVNMDGRVQAGNTYTITEGRTGLAIAHGDVPTNAELNAKERAKTAGRMKVKQIVQYNTEKYGEIGGTV